MAQPRQPGTDVPGLPQAPGFGMRAGRAALTRPGVTQRVVQLMLSPIRDKSAELRAPFWFGRERQGEIKTEGRSKINPDVWWPTNSYLACSKDTHGTFRADAIMKDRTTGLSQGLTVFFTADLHSWNFQPGR